MTTAVQKAPRIRPDDAVRIALEQYGLSVSASTLPSERDQNFLLQTSSGQKFVLKIANAEEQYDFLNLQNELIRFLCEKEIGLEFPRVVPSKSGADIATIKTADS